MDTHLFIYTVNINNKTLTKGFYSLLSIKCSTKKNYVSSNQEAWLQWINEKSNEVGLFIVHRSYKTIVYLIKSPLYTNIGNKYHKKILSINTINSNIEYSCVCALCLIGKNSLSTSRNTAISWKDIKRNYSS